MKADGEEEIGSQTHVSMYQQQTLTDIQRLAVNRGVATTSVASKKLSKEEGTESIPEDDVPLKSGQLPSGIANGFLDGAGPVDHQSLRDEGSKGSMNALPAPEGQTEDWEDEKLAEQAALQQLVDRLHEKGEKEVSRILKAEF